MSPDAAKITARREPVTATSTARHPRVIHVLDSGGVYGIERMLLALLPALRSRGVPVALACLGTSGTPTGAVGDEMAAMGIETSFLRFDSIGNLRGLRALASLLRRSPGAIIHTHGYKATIAAGVISRCFRQTFVTTYHGEASKSVGLDRHIAIETQILRHVHGVAAVSQPIADEVRGRGVNPSRVEVIPNGIPDVRRDRRGVDDVYRIAIIGRLIREKNIHVALESIAKLRASWPAVRVIIAGEGPYREELVRVARELDLAEVVEFRGFVSDVAGLLAEVDAFVMPSQTEGMPIALLEAMAAGVPIVASAVGSIPSVARHRSEALLVEPNDEPALRGAIAELLERRDTAAVLARNARERFLAELTSDAMADRYTSFYTRVRPAINV